MRNSWTQTFRHLAAAFAIGGATAMSSAMCYAQMAFDSASDPAYADGWQAGDNGGTGFTPWNFDSAYYWSFANGGDGNFYPYDGGIKAIDSSNPFNNIGTAWSVGNIQYGVDDNGNPKISFPRAGRGFAPLRIGQTLSLTIDNPSERLFFKGYFLRLNGGTGGVDGNICNTGLGCSPGGTPVEKMRFQTFEYFTNGEWSVQDSGGIVTSVFDTDTAAAGALLQVKRTGAETYDVLMQSLGGGPSFSASRTFSAGPPVDWVELTFFSGIVSDPAKATDFYISSMSITPEPGTITLLVLGAGGVLLGMARRRKDE